METSAHYKEHKLPGNSLGVIDNCVSRVLKTSHVNREKASDMASGFKGISTD